jgi:SAM-dependent methyltransferase
MDSDGGKGTPYVRDIAYRSNFIPAQAPIQLSYVAAIAGYRPPDPATAFHYLDLGCGSGATLNALAAAYPRATFVGVDFNGDSIASARHAAAAAALPNVSYLQASFSGLDAATVAPADFVACSGTFSWLDSGEKAALIRLLGHCLKPGGLLYLGYVTLGRAAVTPMWQVLRCLVPAAAGNSMARVQAGIQLLAELRDNGARYLEQNPEALRLLAEVQAQSLAGDHEALENLSHNVFADGFRAELLDDVAGQLATAQLAFCGNATPFLNDPDLCVPAGVRARHDALESPIAQELLKDFMRATLVRADVFIKDARLDAEAASQYLLDRVQVALLGPRAETWQRLERPDWTTFDFTTQAGRLAFDRIAAGATRIREVVRDTELPPQDVADAFCKLVASPGFELSLGTADAGDGPIPGPIRPASEFNRRALEAAQAGASVVQLAAPGLGSCIPALLPGSLLLAEFCASGTGTPLEVLHARVREQAARMRGVDPAAVRQLSDPRFFADLHRVVTDRTLPPLLRFGALKPA